MVGQWWLCDRFSCGCGFSCALLSLNSFLVLCSLTPMQRSGVECSRLPSAFSLCEKLSSEIKYVVWTLESNGIHAFYKIIEHICHVGNQAYWRISMGKIHFPNIIVIGTCMDESREVLHSRISWEDKKETTSCQHAGNKSFYPEYELESLVSYPPFF